LDSLDSHNTRPSRPISLFKEEEKVVLEKTLSANMSGRNLDKGKISIVLIILVGTVFQLHSGVSFNESNLFTIIQDPYGPSLPVNTPLNLTILNLVQINVTSVTVHYCCLEPDFVCHFPGLNVDKNSQGYFSIAFTPEYEVGTILGYNFEITLENDSILNIPDALDYSDTKLIRKASDNFFYFSLNIIEFNPTTISSKTSTQVNGFSTPLIAYLILPLLIKKYLKNSNK